jgi:purine-binding chemotaxis protein CheW
VKASTLVPSQSEPPKSQPSSRVDDGTGDRLVRDAAAEISRQYSTFFLGNLFFGVEVLRVQEVLRFQELTPVPRAHSVIEGLINLRGQIVTAIDLRRRLGLPSRPEGQRPMNVVIRSEEGAVSLQVDRIGDVLEVDEDSFEPPPDTLKGPASELIRGAYKLQDRLLLILDTDKGIRMPA